MLKHISKPSLVQLNRLPTDFSDKDSVEVIPDYNFQMVPSPTVSEVVIPFSDVSLSDDECEVIVSYGSLSDGE